MKFTKLFLVPFYEGCAYLPGFSKQRQLTERHFTLSTMSMFHKKRSGMLGRLKKKSMGDRNGLCPREEVYSLSSVNPGAITRLGCDEQDLSPVIEKGLDCNGKEIDIETKGASGASVHCGSTHGGSITMGVDSYKPEFYSYERRMPVYCVDAAMTSASEVKKNLAVIREEGPALIMNDLDYLIWDLMVERGTGNTAISDQVRFSQDAGLTGGKFPYMPCGRANHEFFKTIQTRISADPDNHGKKFYVEGSELQIKKAINDHQDEQGIQRQSYEKVVDPYRIGDTMFHYDGIHYVIKEYPDYVGASKVGGEYAIVRPRNFVHQAGTEYGVVTRPNYALAEDSCKINCNGAILDKIEVMHWYIEDAIYFVPFMARKGKVPTNGREEIKDHVYATPASFKTYYLKDHAVETPQNCQNDRGQYQQMGMMTKWGLFHRPDKIQFGYVLAQPVERCITIRTGCNEKPMNNKETDAVGFDSQGTVKGGACGKDCGDTPTIAEAPGTPLSEAPTPDNPFPDNVDEVAGEIGFCPSNFTAYECTSGSIKVCFERSGGRMGALEGIITSKDDTAVADTNYTPIPDDTKVAWADGEMGSKCIEIPILEAGITEDKTFDICLAVGKEVITETVTIKACPEGEDPCPNCQSGCTTCGDAK